jgi:dTDP-4-dehydrorhamnose 3,5-epimerase
MKFKELKLKSAYIITLDSFNDERGNFTRLFCKKELSKIGFNKEIIQINHSYTKKKSTVRGMHFQYPPHAEIKIIKCVKGSVFDVIIDLRKGSPTFLKWHGEILSEKNNKIIYVPEGFAHGFQTLEDNCELIYLHSNEYNKESEGSINHLDSKIGINWPLKISNISEKDLNIPFLDKIFKGI